MGVGETRYVDVGDCDVAYRVLGDTGPDLLYFWGIGSHLELLWDNPQSAGMYQRLAEFSRLIMFDRRGTGASDRLPRSAPPSWEQWADDLIAVLDATGTQRAAVLAEADAGPIALMCAAMHPDRLTALAVVDTTARVLRGPDYPIGMDLELAHSYLELIASSWGSVEFARLIGPREDVPRDYHAQLARMLRSAVTPRTAAAQYEAMMHVDARAALPLIQLPTLVLHHVANQFIPVSHGRYLAEHIPGARLVELDGGESGLHAYEQDRWLPELAEFFTGRRTSAATDRVLTTILFTDIVDSTASAARLGDGAWRAVLDRHDVIVRRELDRHGGREVHSLGDGFCASFDRPTQAVRCAQSLGQALEGVGLHVRAGLHTGECEIRAHDLSGLAVHIAARVGSLAGAGEVLVSSTVRDLVVGSELRFAEHGEHQLKGVPDPGGCSR